MDAPMASAFDTLQAAKQLEGCGFECEQAETVAAVVQSAQDDLATKTDLSATKADLKAEILKAAVAIIGLNAAIMLGLLSLFAGDG